MQINQDTLDRCAKYGAKCEDEAAVLIKKVKPNAQVVIHRGTRNDYKNHVDLEAKIDAKSLTFDVKDTNKHCNDRVWVEMVNVDGNKGWIYGKADGFLFKMKDFWLSVSRKHLVKLTEKLVDPFDWVYDKDRAVKKVYVGRHKYQRQSRFNGCVNVKWHVDGSVKWLPKNTPPPKGAKPIMNKDETSILLVSDIEKHIPYKKYDRNTYKLIG